MARYLCRAESNMCGWLNENNLHTKTWGIVKAIKHQHIGRDTFVLHTTCRKRVTTFNIYKETKDVAIIIEVSYLLGFNDLFDYEKELYAVFNALPQNDFIYYFPISWNRIPATNNYWLPLCSLYKIEPPRSFETVRSCALYIVSGQISQQKTVTPR